MIIMGVFGRGCSYIFLGPSEVLGIPESLWIVCLGDAIAGFFAAMIFSSLIPYMHQCAFEYENAKEEKNDILNILSSVYNSFTGMGGCTAYLIQPVLAEELGYRYLTDICFAFAMTGMLIFTIFSSYRPVEAREGMK